MLKGLVFNLQTFTSEAFALFIDKFLNGKSGVARGCELSNTNNSITVGEGYFVVRLKQNKDKNIFFAGRNKIATKQQ